MVARFVRISYASRKYDKLMKQYMYEVKIGRRKEWVTYEGVRALNKSLHNDDFTSPKQANKFAYNYTRAGIHNKIVGLRAGILTTIQRHYGLHSDSSEFKEIESFINGLDEPDLHRIFQRNKSWFKNDFFAYKMESLLPGQKYATKDGMMIKVTQQMLDADKSEKIEELKKAIGMYRTYGR